MQVERQTFWLGYEITFAMSPLEALKPKIGNLSPEKALKMSPKNVRSLVVISGEGEIVTLSADIAMDGEV